MFGNNKIVGKKYFKNAEQDKLLVTNISYTIQKEGKFIGHPVIALRLGKCNLACSFCDVYFDSGELLTFNEILYRAEKTVIDTIGYYPIWAKERIGLSVTGGEPMLQSNLSDFLNKFLEYFAFTQVESNGIVYQELPPSTTLLISPKCIEKNGKQIKYFKPSKPILNKAESLNFIISEDKNSMYNNIPEWADKWCNDTGKIIYITPMNVYIGELYSKEIKLDVDQNKENSDYAVEFCIKKGYTLNLQIDLYENTLFGI